MKLKIKKQQIYSTVREIKFFLISIHFDLDKDKNLLDKFFREDFNISLPVEGAREKRESLTSSRPITKINLNLKAEDCIELLFYHESDANIFVEKLKEQIKYLFKILREKSQKIPEMKEIEEEI